MGQAASKNPRQPIKLGVIATGGTIGSAVRDDIVSLDGSHRDLSLLPSALRDGTPIEWSIRRPIDVLSENMEPDNWDQVAQSVRDVVRKDHVQGVVILHGTDTMTYTANALSFLLSDLATPVVLTGASLSPDRPGSDALTNVADAAAAATQLEPGVYVSFSGIAGRKSYVHAGTAVRKMVAAGQAFFSINREPVATVTRGRVEVIAPLIARHPVHITGATDDVMTVEMEPGHRLDRDFQAMFQTGVRGVVIKLYPSATGPDIPGPYSLPQFVKACTATGKVIVCTLNEAPPEQGLDYETTAALRATGAVILERMLPETARVKLRLALGNYDNPQAVKRFMNKEVAGEMNASPPLARSARAIA